MSSVVISGDTSGAVTVAAPAVAGSNTLTLLAATATNSVNTLATAVASTSGTSIDFTGLPNWIKRITVMFSGISTSGTSNIQIQIGSGSVTTSGYSSEADQAGVGINASSGFIITRNVAATTVFSGIAQICLLGSNTWIISGTLGQTNNSSGSFFSGSIALGGTLDRVRITTVNGTDTYDAGSINIMYEG